MIINGVKDDVENTFPTPSRAFKIATNGKAFKILSDNLYSDRISAIIRELSCNAIDAHVQGNNSDPFEVTLPNRVNPIFIVKDNGIGLSEEDVHEVYTTYFESTKNNSNDYIGALGLGSKSPFSYTKSFTVISRFQGKKYTYLCYLDESSTPTLMKIQEENTQDRNGLEVSFSVNESDINEFSSKAENIFKFFDKKPIIHGKQITIPSLLKEKSILKDNWIINANVNGLCFIMGGVSYFIDRYNTKGLSDKALNLGKWDTIIKVPIGYFDITPSREKIIVDAIGIQKINEMADMVNNKIEEYFFEKIELLKTDWEKRRAVLEYPYQIRNNFGVPYLNRNTVFKEENEYRVKVTLPKKPLVNEKETLLQVFSKKGSIYKTSLFTENNSEERIFFIDCDCSFIYDPEKNRKSYLKVRKYIRDNNLNQAILFHLPIVKNTIKEVFGNPPIISVSDIPDPLKVKTQRTTCGMTREYEILSFDTSGNGEVKNIRMSLTNLCKTYTYYSDRYFSENNIYSALNTLNYFSNNPELSIVYLTNKNRSVMKTKEFLKGTLKHVDSLFLKCLDLYVNNNPNLHRALLFTDMYFEYERLLSYTRFSSISYPLYEGKITNPKSLFLKTLIDRNKFLKEKENYIEIKTNFSSLCHLLKKEITDVLPSILTTKITKEYEFDEELIKKTYPLLFQLERGLCYRNDIEDVLPIIEYINLIDSKI